MDLRDVKALTARGEGQRVEFKEAARDLERTICAFANARGGVIIIGVDDRGAIKGCALDNRARARLADIARNAEPSIEIELEQVGELWVLRVPEQDDKPYSVGGRFFVRKGATNRQMSPDEIRDMFFDEGRLRFDAMACRDFSLERDLDDESWARFHRNAKLPRDVGDRVATLENLKLITEAGQMTNAGAWLLARRIGRFNIGATITCAKFFGTEKDEILDLRDFDADINSMLASAEDWIKSNLNIRYDTSQFRRKEIPELPMDALREAVVNALAHRDYRATASIKIFLFHDRLEVVSPGGLPKGVDKSAFGRVSAPRNPLLFEIMQRMQLVEKVGYGISSMRKACREQGLPEPRFEIDDHWFVVTFARVAAETPDELADKSQTELQTKLQTKLPGKSQLEPSSKKQTKLQTELQTEPPAEPPAELPAELAGKSQLAPSSKKPAELPAELRSGSLETRVINLLYLRQPLSSAEISKNLGQKGTSAHLKKVLRELVANGRLAYAIPQTPRSPNQRYLLTRSEQAALDGKAKK